MSRKETRERILRATYELATEGDPTASMGRIAERAGISRQAVYLHFDSRTELLLELVRWVDETKGLGERMRACLELPDPVERLEAAARAGAAYEEEIREITLPLDIARHSDEAAAAAWSDRMSARRRYWARLFADVARAGRLRARWSHRSAGEAFSSLSSPGSYRELVDDCGWSAEEYEEWVVELLHRVFIAAAS